MLLNLFNLTKYTMETLKNKSNNHSDDIANIREATKSQLSKGIVLQNYCNSVLQQPSVDFSSDPDLKEMQQKINNGLGIAKEHATTYLSTISPNILNALSALNNYFTLYSSVPVTLPQGSTVDQWVSSLSAVKKVSEDNLRDCNIILNSLQLLDTDLRNDATSFSQIVQTLNSLVNGDNGELENISSQLKSLDSQIAGSIVGTVFGGLGIAGGVFMIVVGSVADFVTAGTNPELVIGGVATVIAGVGAEAGTIVTLVSLYKQKADLLTQQSKLKAEVNLVTGIDSAYEQLSNQVTAAVTAADYMLSAWKLLSEDLDSMIQDLQFGILSADAVRTMFLQEANTDIQRLLDDINVVKIQMAGVTQVNLPSGTNIAAYLNSLNEATQIQNSTLN